MKLLILSDTHGERILLKRVLAKEADADAAFFLGDGLREIENWPGKKPPRGIYAVRGNCDYTADYPLEGLVPFDGLLFFYTHGHAYNVKTTLGPLLEAAQARGADVVLFGHTHNPLNIVENGIHVFNPGSVALSPRLNDHCYGVITTEPGGGIRLEHRCI